MSDRLQKFLPLFLGILIISNLVFLDFYLVTQKKEEPVEILSSPIVQPISDCSSCQGLVQKEVSKQLVLAPTLTPSPTFRASPTPTPTVVIANNPKVIYIPITNSGLTNLMDWTDVPGSDFYFNLVDYPGAVSVKWEAQLKSVNSPNQVAARIYDVTNSRGVDYSDLQTRSGTYALLQSSAITIWRGNNLYRVQLKADNGTEASLGMGRLKIGY